ncbi:MAG: Inner membrane protein YjdF [Planctomycetes bacterium]|nr:Inner membrane protein YjdF [Planctomycetota bacterium]
MRPRRLPVVLLALYLAAAAASFVGVEDVQNWVSETLPAWVGCGILVATHRRFPLSGVNLVLCFVFALILHTGGRYTYAKVPLGEWWKEWWGFERNHFDRMGHFFQGVIPAMLARELLLRRTPLRPGPRVFFLCSAAALAISALYEIVEWRYAVAFGGEAAEDFLGSQGDLWDAQKDMTAALLGAMSAQLLLGGILSRQIAAIRAEPPR